MVTPSSSKGSARVALVTGCSTGIGRSLARELHRRGYRTFASARRPEAIGDLAAEGLEIVTLDVTDVSSIASAVADVIARAGQIDVLLNNAGVNQFGPLAEVPLDDARRLFETNVIGLLAVTQAVFPHMAERRTGRVMNVGSVVGLLPTPFAGTYCASKAAVHMISDVLRMEAKPFGIDVVVVQPGGVVSKIADTGAVGLDRYRAASSRYRNAFAGIEKRAYSSQKRAMPSEDFARRVLDEALGEPAPRIVRAGTGSKQLPLLARIPGVQRDAVLSGHYGLDAFEPEDG